MSLVETFETVRPSVVALGSRLAQTRQGETPGFPTILGTGFVVDARGIVMTNRHVANALQHLPAKCAMAVVFPRVETGEGGRAQPVLFRQVLAYNLLEQFHSTGTFYGD